MIEIRSLQNWETHEWLLHVHYAKRIPSITFAFGLFVDGKMKGLVTYGTPPSPSLCEGIAGKENIGIVLELNRLVFVEKEKNYPSMLVSRSLKKLPTPTIVVSYADIGQGHVGYVYQACNFIYTGLSAKRTDWKIKGMEHLHGKTIANMVTGAVGGSANFLREKYGDDFYLEQRSRKHRYIYVVAKGKQKEHLIESLKYGIEPYPKGDSVNYEIDYSPSYQMGLI